MRGEAEVRRMVEFLPDDCPSVRRSIQIGDIPWGPEGIPRLLALQEKYGAGNVTTAFTSRDGWVGVYVRSDVLTPAENPLREYLSRA